MVQLIGGILLMLFGLLILPGATMGQRPILIFAALMAVGFGGYWVVDDYRSHRSTFSWWRKFQPHRWQVAAIGAIMIPVCIFGGWGSEWDTGSVAVGWNIGIVAAAAMVLASPFLPKRPEL